MAKASTVSPIGDIGKSPAEVWLMVRVVVAHWCFYTPHMQGGMKIASLGPHTSTEIGEKHHDRSAERRAVAALPAGDRPGRGGHRAAQARAADRHCCAPPRGGSAEALCMPGPPRAGRAVCGYTGH